MDKTYVLMILDGWGISQDQKHNAIAMANTPQWDNWWQTKAHCLLDASGHSVGLPKNQMGNSEVGHMHIGSGRTVEQDFTRINQAISTDHFMVNPAFTNAVENAKKNNKTIHIMGLLSDGGVHSHQEHLFALLQLLSDYDYSNAVIHVFLDGRDTPPRCAKDSINTLEKHLEKHPVAEIKSVTGRYYAMDRDARWERLQPVYDLLTTGKCEHHANNAEQAIESAYLQDVSDEFIPPTLIGTPKPIKDDDIVIFFNFRSDRARQLSYALTQTDFSGFERSVIPDINLVTMTQYAKNLDATAAFPPPSLKNTLGEVIASEGLTQLRLAETEKYAHVTFFLNGGNEVVFAGEDRILIPSAKVATYDLKPQMSAGEITNVLLESIQQQDYDLIICNYANADMVGHTGNIDAAITAIEYLDSCFARINPLVESGQVELLITADHGNAEFMYNDALMQAHTAHTCEPVPLLYVGSPANLAKPTGSLIDIAPSLLHLMKLDIPSEMQGMPLFEPIN